MTVPSMIYKLLVGPLELLFEMVFAFAYRHLHHAGLAIIVLSLTVNFLVLPLYRRADALQKEEQDLEKKLKPWLDHIKNTFSGDERYMMMQTFYRQNDYKPSYALRGSFSLLLQIPFFMAAYNFLSNLKILQGASFGPIVNLGAPDALLTVGGITFNILPILMTLINFTSAAIYMKGLPIKKKLLTYGMALVFLILLYHSPSGLAFYWTLNNLFSLIKNIAYKISLNGKGLRVSLMILSVLGLILLNAALILRPSDSLRIKLYLAAGILLTAFFLYFVGNRKDRHGALSEDRPDDLLFILGCVFLTILTGVLIPSSVIESAIGDFINIRAYHSPLWYVVSSLLLAAGTFIVWFGIFYRLALPRGRKIMSFLMYLLSVCASVNYMFFGTDRGVLSPFLQYENVPTDTIQEYLVNIVILLQVIFFLYFFFIRKSRLVHGLLLACCLAGGIMSVNNIFRIGKHLPAIQQQARETAGSIPEIKLSKSGKNVIILMMDRAIGYYVPFIMQERPELQSMFEGFTFYPNTLSYANMTNGGVPSIYGGYEYTPAMMNKRDSEPLKIKHDEALLMMPELFHEAGYEVTVIDPSYAGYSWISDLHLYDDYPYVHAYHMNGMFTTKDYNDYQLRTWERVFFCFSIYKTAPLFIQPMLYTGGLYNDPDAIAGKSGAYPSTQRMNGLYKATGISGVFNSSFSSLLNLINITDVNESDFNTYTTLENTTTHSPQLLQLPDYTMSDNVDNTDFESNPIRRQSTLGETITIGTANQVKHYHVNMAAMIELGKWLDYLRENDVYNNTRIIIAADHGRDQGFDQFMIGQKYFEDILFFNPTLMVKDFDSDQPFTIDQQFMTNADVPTIAMEGIVTDPVNPFTGNPVTNEAKSEEVHEVQRIKEFNVVNNNGNTFLPTEWFALHGNNIFDTGSWEFLGIR